MVAVTEINIGPRVPSRCLSVLGTGSDVGKSVVVAALCRIFANRGIRVAPFKAQNMSNNSYVTLQGGEVGRAQVVQAEAARVPVHVDMNPVLLKPSSDTGSQVVVQGYPVGNSEASAYFADTEILFRKAKESLARLRAEYELVVMEGAGSCAEVNLRNRDFVNFRMAHAAGAPVILVADIDRGGVFAQIIGSLEVIPPEDRRCVRGIVINRFRGDPDLFSDGIEYIEARTGIPVLGLVHFYRHIEIDSEDGMPLDVVIDPPAVPNPDSINIAVVRLPHISNFTDFAPLARIPRVALHYLSKPRPLAGYDIVFLPGAKNVRADLEWVRTTGWDKALLQYLDLGGKLGGICGGYQMLGRVILDPHGIEGAPGQTEGLGLLDLKTTLKKEKVLSRSTGVWLDNRKTVEGYEIHMGVTERMGDVPHIIRVKKRNGVAVDDCDGARSKDGRVWGTYFHGLFDHPVSRHAFLGALKPECPVEADESLERHERDYKERQYDLLAEHFEKYLDMTKLIDIVGIRTGRD
ncbi:MAG: cobyric acid synthase [Acidobacteria bacterium]|nr:cobyric acid synthase [Acidobacteriota bacterium]